MGLARFIDVGAVWAFPRWNEPLQEARDYHVVTGNPTVEKGPWGNALVFDGVNDYITLSAAWEDQLRFDSGAQDFSVCAWVRRAVTGAHHVIIDKRDGNNDGWFFWIRSSDEVRFSLGGANAFTNEITDALWHCLIAVVDRSASINIYIDGVPDGTPLAIAGPVMATTTAPRIGAQSFDAANKWNGAIAGVFVIPRILSPEECLGLATGGGF